MPKRTNPFQGLIFTIQHSITDNATVTESKMLTNIHTGSDVEVDIVIEVETGTIPMIIGIECTATGRPATVEWIHEMYGKHQALPTNKLVLVSQSGYSTEAEDLAQAHGIEAISLQEGESFDWSQMVTDLVGNPNLRIANFQIHNKSWSIKFDPVEKDRLALKEWLSFSDESEIVNSEGVVLGSVQQLGIYVHRNRSIVERIMGKWIERREGEFKLTWRAIEGTQISDADGELYLIQAVVFDGYCEVESLPLHLTAAKYRRTQVAYSNIADIFSGSTGEVTVLFTEQDGEPAKGWLGFSSDSGFGKQIFPANRPSTVYDPS